MLAKPAKAYNVCPPYCHWTWVLY